MMKVHKSLRDQYHASASMNISENRQKHAHSIDILMNLSHAKNSFLIVKAFT